MPMKLKIWSACALVTACVIVASGAAAQGGKGGKKIDGGKGSAFKSKKYDLKEKGEIAIVLTFEAGKEVTVTTKGEKETDVNLYVKGKYFEAKDISPGPDCLVKFTPVKGDPRFTLTIKNRGPGANKVTLEVKVSD
jgi:hypothetical protein